MGIRPEHVVNGKARQERWRTALKIVAGVPIQAAAAIIGLSAG